MAEIARRKNGGGRKVKTGGGSSNKPRGGNGGGSGRGSGGGSAAPDTTTDPDAIKVLCVGGGVIYMLPGPGLTTASCTPSLLQVPANRERAIQITLHHFKPIRKRKNPAEAIVKAVLALDPDALGGDPNLLLNILPTLDEYRQCQVRGFSLLPVARAMRSPSCRERCHSGMLAPLRPCRSRLASYGRYRGSIEPCLSCAPSCSWRASSGTLSRCSVPWRSCVRAASRCRNASSC